MLPSSNAHWVTRYRDYAVTHSKAASDSIVLFQQETNLTQKQDIRPPRTAAQRVYICKFGII
jgi:hypothetical protein